MTQEEDRLPEENGALQRQVSLQQEKCGVQEELIGALQQQVRVQEQELNLLKQEVQGLQERLKKDSHNSHLPRRRIASGDSRAAYAREAALP
jgi:hypothetical protein